MEPRRRALLLFGVGILLVLNPVYLFPAGAPVEKTYTYSAEPVGTYYDLRDDVRPSAVLNCADGIRYRECVQAREIGYDGTLRVDNDTAVHLESDERGLFFGYDHVRFEEGYARPTATVENRTLVLSFEPLSETAVMREYAVEYEDLPPVGKAAVREGSATTTRQFDPGEDIVPEVRQYERFAERNGTFYSVTRYPSETNRPVPVLGLKLLRLALLGTGVGLAFVGASRYGRAGE